MRTDTDITTCTFCPFAASDMACGRCGNPLCLEHVPLGNRRCDGCELVYEQRKSGLRLAAYAIPPFVLALIAYALVAPGFVGLGLVAGPARGFSTGVPVLDLFVMFALTAWVTSKSAVALRLRFLRRAFLAERGAPRLRFDSEAFRRASASFVAAP